MDTESVLHLPRSKEEGRIGCLGVFGSPPLERAFREQHFRDHLWLSSFLVVAGTFRVALFLLADYQHFGVGHAFWPLLTSRLLFLLVSVWVLVALRRARAATAADRLFFAWACLLVAMTIHAIAARPPSNTDLLLMSFGTIVVVYCVAPLPLSRQAALALTYSTAALLACRKVDGATLSTVAGTHVLSHLFGAVTSWRLNSRRREMFLAVLREARLRAELEAAMAEVRTLRGLLPICAWCKRIRDERQNWESVEKYVQSRTHASFTHGICPDCLQSQVKGAAYSRV